MHLQCTPHVLTPLPLQRAASEWSSSYSLAHRVCRQAAKIGSAEWEAHVI